MGRTCCSNLNYYKPQTESHQQHLALYMDRHLSLVAIMIEVTSRHMKCTHFHSHYSRMPAVALQCLLIANFWTAGDSTKRLNFAQKIFGWQHPRFNGPRCSMTFYYWRVATYRTASDCSHACNCLFAAFHRCIIQNPSAGATHNLVVKKTYSVSKHSVDIFVSIVDTMEQCGHVGVLFTNL